MAVKVQFEIGHTAKLKSKKTPDGFTHDWELFVRGIDKVDISHFVEKVVFNLHDSFPKPKRVIKETPYVLKESGYAGFVLPIDIYFRNRDEPKRVTYNYDLDLQQTGPPVFKSEIKKYIFNNPSDDFRRKLLKGGGISLVNNSDEKSRDSVDERSQLLSKPKLSGDVAKKHNKIRPDENTFAILFGTPITKTSTKVSPDPKSKSSPSLNTVNTKSTKSSEKSSSSTSGSIRDKSDKTDKKEKHKHTSPHKDRDVVSKDVKKNSNDDKYDRREEKKKDKTHSKERDRSKDKSTKRPLSPKRQPSPKRPSPARSSSNASRTTTEENGYKQSAKSSHADVGSAANNNNNYNNNNNSEKSVAASSSSASSSSNKKSKKDKKSHDKDKERDKKDKDRDRKDERSSSSTASLIAPAVLNHASNSNAKAISSEGKIDLSKKDKESITPLSRETKESKKSITDGKLADPTSSVPDKKVTDKHDKDAEKKHKHKKKDKNKEKDKEKDHSSKDKKKDKSSKNKDEQKKIPQSQMHVDSAISAQKSNSNPLDTLMNEISDKDTSDSEPESAPASVSERPEIVSESSNSSLPDVVVTKPPPPPPPPVLPAVVQEEVTKPEKKEKKSRDRTKFDKDEKKRKRKSKEETSDTQQQQQQSRKSVSPAITEPPPPKQTKKDDQHSHLKNGEKSNSPLLPPPTSSSSSSSAVSALLPPASDETAFRAPSSSSSLSTTTTTGQGGGGVGTSTSVGSASGAAAAITSSASTLANNNALTNHDRTLTMDYMSELRDLHQKIMTLQDNNELQQVVEMIAATGRFEITSKTFDFDLCALDPLTVQRLQDFFATSCS